MFSKMASKKQALADCKAALVALDQEIKTAKENVKAREVELRRAINCEIREDTVMGFHVLFEHSANYFNNLQKQKLILLKRETKLGSFVSNYEEENWEIPQDVL